MTKATQTTPKHTPRRHQPANDAGTEPRRPRRGSEALTATNDYVRSLRQRGFSLRAIAFELHISVGKVSRALYTTKRQAANDNHCVVRHVTSIGVGGSGTCQRVPVRLPRVTFIDGPFAGAVAQEGVAA